MSIKCDAQSVKRAIAETKAATSEQTMRPVLLPYLVRRSSPGTPKQREASDSWTPEIQEI